MRSSGGPAVGLTYPGLSCIRCPQVAAGPRESLADRRAGHSAARTTWGPAAGDLCREELGERAGISPEPETDVTWKATFTAAEAKAREPRGGRLCRRTGA